jgi:integrase
MPKLLWALSTATPRDRAFFTVCLFTGARGGEVRHMEWQHVNLERRIWFKPTSKNGKPHRIPFPRQVVEALAALPREGRWVFLGTAGEPISPDTPRKTWRAFREVAGLPDVTIHDLRRSAATLASEP